MKKRSEIPPKILYRTNFTKLLHVFFPFVRVFWTLIGFVFPHYPFYHERRVTVVWVAGLGTKEIAMVRFQFGTLAEPSTEDEKNSQRKIIEVSKGPVSFIEFFLELDRLLLEKYQSKATNGTTKHFICQWIFIQLDIPIHSLQWRRLNLHRTYHFEVGVSLRPCWNFTLLVIPTIRGRCAEKGERGQDQGPWSLAAGFPCFSRRPMVEGKTRAIHSKARSFHVH